MVGARAAWSGAEPDHSSPRDDHGAWVPGLCRGLVQGIKWPPVAPMHR